MKSSSVRSSCARPHKKAVAVLRFPQLSTTSVRLSIPARENSHLVLVGYSDQHQFSRSPGKEEMRVIEGCVHKIEPPGFVIRTMVSRALWRSLINSSTCVIMMQSNVSLEMLGAFVRSATIVAREFSALTSRTSILLTRLPPNRLL